MTGDQQPFGSDPAHLSLEEWAMVERSWAACNEDLDRALAMYAQHRSYGNCSHPTCVTPAWEAQMEALDDNTLRALLHAAIHRLEVARLEKEAGL